MPWNKGKKLSLETRVRMSLAKQGRTYSRTTRRSMSRAHLSLGHSPVSRTASHYTGFVGSQLGRFRLYLHERVEESDMIASCTPSLGLQLEVPATDWHEEQEGEVTCDNASFSALGTKEIISAQGGRSLFTFRSLGTWCDLAQLHWCRSVKAI